MNVNPASLNPRVFHRAAELLKIDDAPDCCCYAVTLAVDPDARRVHYHLPEVQLLAHLFKQSDLCFWWAPPPDDYEARVLALLLCAEVVREAREWATPREHGNPKYGLPYDLTGFVHVTDGADLIRHGDVLVKDGAIWEWAAGYVDVHVDTYRRLYREPCLTDSKNLNNGNRVYRPVPITPIPEVPQPVAVPTGRIVPAGWRELQCDELIYAGDCRPAPPKPVSKRVRRPATAFPDPQVFLNAAENIQHTLLDFPREWNREGASSFCCIALESVIRKGCCTYASPEWKLFVGLFQPAGRNDGSSWWGTCRDPKNQLARELALLLCWQIAKRKRYHR